MRTLPTEESHELIRGSVNLVPTNFLDAARREGQRGDWHRYRTDRRSVVRNCNRILQQSDLPEMAFRGRGGNGVQHFRNTGKRQDQIRTTFRPAPTGQRCGRDVLVERSALRGDEIHAIIGRDGRDLTGYSTNNISLLDATIIIYSTGEISTQQPR